MNPSVQPPSISRLLSELERAAYGQQPSQAIALMLQLLRALKAHQGPHGVLGKELSSADRRAAYTRVAAAITALSCGPGFGLNMEQIATLCDCKPVLEAVFELSGFEGAQHLLRYFQEQAPDQLSLSAQQAFLLSLFFSLDAVPEELLRASLTLPPDLLLPLMLGWLVTPFVHSPRGEHHRGLLIEADNRIESASLQTRSVRTLSGAWMYCSYADHPDKHRLKKSLNAVWRGYAKAVGVRERTAPRRLGARPTLVVCAERMSSDHAMQRSYAHCLRQLKARFRVVCLVSEHHYSPDCRELFDELVLINEPLKASEAAGQLVKQEPDIVYYPSLGMSTWTVLLANHRFAPIQIMTLGHPAPAMTDSIDYSLVQAGHGVLAGEFGAKLIERRAYGRFEAHPDLLGWQPPPGLGKHQDGKIHIAVNSAKMKLSPRFLNLCRRLEREARQPLHLHFFASIVGIGYDRMRQELERSFQSVTLEPYRPYKEFLNELARCDLALAAFPFGNTNSSFDCCLLGVPVVAYVGTEVLSIGDRDVLSIAGAPEWLLASDEDQYFRAVMRLIEDADARQLTVRQLGRAVVEDRFLGRRDDNQDCEFVDAFWWIFQNHEALQASSRHLLRVGEPIPS